MRFPIFRIARTSEASAHFVIFPLFTTMPLRRLLIPRLLSLLGLLCLALTPWCVRAQSGVLVDLVSGQAILEDRADERASVGALNRLVVLDALFSELERRKLSLSDTLAVKEAHAEPLSLKAGESADFETLLVAYAAQGNERAACEAVRTLFPDDTTFAAALAASLGGAGVKDSGLERKETSLFPVPNVSPKDMAVFIEGFLDRRPEARRWWSQTDVQAGGRSFNNGNVVLPNDHTVSGLVIGGEEKNWSGAAVLENPLPDGSVRRLLSVSVSQASRKMLISTLGESLQAGLRQFETVTLYRPGDSIGTLHAYGGERPELAYTVRDEIHITLSREELMDNGLSALSLRLEHPTPLMAPVREGDVLGTLTLTYNGEIFKKIPVVALESLEKGSFWQRLRDTVLLAVSDEDGFTEE